jgi:hypothetical protein
MKISEKTNMYYCGCMEHTGAENRYFGALLKNK